MGTRVVCLREDGSAMMGEVQTSRGFQSASSPWLSFGFGREATHGSLHLFWPSGRQEQIPPGATGRRLWIREGEGIIREETL